MAHTTIVGALNGPYPHHHDWFSLIAFGAPLTCTNFSADPVFPAMSTGKLPKTPEDVPIAEWVASSRPSWTYWSAVGSTFTGCGGCAPKRRSGGCRFGGCSTS